MKYMGGKGRIVDEILPIMLSKYNGNTFVDIFCGGCSVIEKVPKTYRRIANDKQKYLIAMWRVLTSGGVPPMRIERDYYCDVRDSYNKDNDNYLDWIKGWVGFMGSFNGRFFDGGYSGHNVIGKNCKSRDYITENINNTRAQIPNLIGVEWNYGNYYDLELPPNSLIYCDPPYRGTKQYTTSKNFDYERFYQWCRDKKKEGHTIFISEYDMPSDFKCIWEKQVTNAMHQINTKKPVEKLFIPSPLHPCQG